MVWILLLAAGCTEYNVGSSGDVAPGGTTEPDDTAPAGSPDLAVTPDAWEEVVCGSTVATVVLGNDGDADLSIEGLSVEGAGWALLSHEDLPYVLGPGDETTVSLSGEPGTATLFIDSDDPNVPSWEVPLVATVDQVPWVQVVAPGDSEVLDPGDPVSLVAQVGDDVDAVEDLIVTWASNTDGELGQAVVDKTGLSSLTWLDTPRTEGDQILTVTVEDSCGGTSGDELGVCQQAGYVVEELDLSAWHFEGEATWDTTNNWLQLTSPSVNVIGTAFKIDEVVRGDAIEINFLFFIGEGSGADGLSLTVIDKDRMTTYLGGSGCGNGYGGDASCTAGPALPGWTLEIDTYDNGTSIEPTPNDHIAFTFDGDVDGYSAWAEVPELEDTGWHEMSVIVADPRLIVIMDGVTYIDRDLSGYFGFEGYVGFTAGTGSLTNRHMIDSLEVTELVCEE
jgi:hypothetical protein